MSKQQKDSERKKVQVSLAIDPILRQKIRDLKSEMNKSESFFVDSALQNYFGGMLDDTWIKIYMPTWHAAFTEVMNRIYRDSQSPSRPTNFAKIILEIDSSFGSSTLQNTPTLAFEMDSWFLLKTKDMAGLARVGHFYCYERYKAAKLFSMFKKDPAQVKNLVLD